jgi:putative peptidoglycan lipid II flippase
MNFKTKHIGLTGMWILQGAVSFGAQAVIAAYFGASAGFDAYLVGTTLPTTIYMVISSGLSAATTMYFNQVKAREGEAEAFQCISGLLVMALAVGIFLGSLLFVQAGRLVTGIAPGLSQTVSGEAVGCLKLTSMALPFLMIYSLLTGFLNAQYMFFSTTLAGTLLVGLVPLPVLLGAPVSPDALAWGFNAGALGACALLLMVGLRSG